MTTRAIGAAVTGMSPQTSQADRPNPLLVEPKLMLPRVQPRMLRRERLLQLLDGDEGAALTVVNAPVGYGWRSMRGGERPQLWSPYVEAIVVALAPWLALVCTASGRLDEAEREAMHGERLRRSPQPTVAHAHALLVLAKVRVSRVAAGARRRRPQTRGLDDRGVPDPGRLPAIAASIERNLTIAGANAGNGHLVEEPSAAELAVLRYLATGLSPSARSVGSCASR